MEEQLLQLLAALCEDDIVLRDRTVDLFEEDLLDSLAFAELLFEIEDRFGVVIAPSEVAKDEVNTPEKILSLVKGRLHA